MDNKTLKQLFSIPVIVAALGYFVDIYDLLLFTIVKAPSMRGVGATDITMLADSTRVINWQMSGMLIGGGIGVVTTLIIDYTMLGKKTKKAAATWQPTIGASSNGFSVGAAGHF